MARDENTLPDDTAMLCEACGYILTGLTAESNCPECGQPISGSSPNLRHLPSWEQDDGPQPDWQRFWSTSKEVVFRPASFYRSLAVRGNREMSRRYARRNWILVTLLLGWTGSFQLLWMFGITSSVGATAWTRQFHDLTKTGQVGSGLILAVAGFVFCCVLTYAALVITTRLAARLTAWEARFRNLRLAHNVVLRALDYHSAHYLPVAVAAFAVVGSYQLLLITGILDDTYGPRYLYILCALVFLAAAYLFRTYWTAMRNLMFANP